MAVIDGHGGYVPLYRVDRSDVAAQHGGRGRGESAVPARDENHVTMACEAAANALARSGIERQELEAVLTASVSDPFAEHGIAPHVAYRLGATGDVRTEDLRGSRRAATDALASAQEFVAANDAPALVVGVDVLPADPEADDVAEAGAGAGAVVLRPDAESPAAELTGVGEATTGFVEHHRRHGEAAESGDAKFESQHGVGEAAPPAIERALDGAEPTKAVAVAPNDRHAGAALSDVEVEQVSTRDRVGDAGAAAALLDLAHMLESADVGETALVVAYGAGGAGAVALETADGVGTADAKSVATYLDASEQTTYAKHLEYREPVEYEGVKTP
ncbi:hypothetical protein [Halorientalis sp. IM1011]|uniref:hypothetical protein n=1 Tax=Halorientalis sp. IM1011 TaxID=1932360 RepID=UPI0012FB9E92|nr:hypothetical protein [Halorientalis sp. IM1011]